MRWACAVLLLFASALPVAAQGLRLSPTEHREAEAYLEAADLDGLRAWMNAGVGRREAAPRLQAVLDRVDVLLEQSYARMRVYMDQRLRMSDRFSEVLAGPLATALYDRFAEQAREQNDAEAIALFEAAQYLKVRYEGEVLVRLEAALETTEAAYARGDIAEADSVLGVVRPHFPSPAAQHREVINRLLFLEGRVNEILGRAERQVRFYGQRERVTRRVGLALGGSILERGATGTVTFDVPSEAGLGPSIDLVGFGAAATPAFSVEGHVYLTSFLALGGGAVWSRSSYSNESTTEPYFVDFPVTSRVAYGLVRSLLRTEVGIRPYLSGGVGVLQMTREASDAAVLEEVEEDETLLRPFTLPGDEERGLQARAGLGFEYLACGACMASAGVELTLVRNLIESELAPEWQAALGVRVFVAR